MSGHPYALRLQTWRQTVKGAVAKSKKFQDEKRDWRILADFARVLIQQATTQSPEQNPPPLDERRHSSNRHLQSSNRR
jgi:hypothetical protein